jgi:CheY-like chemotaxis protein
MSRRAFDKNALANELYTVTDGEELLPSLPPTAAEAVTLRASETVLIVEDDERVRVLARTILRKYGYQVLEAQSGSDALIVCEQHTAPIHLLLTDVVLPRVSGPELAARLVVSRPDMKVLYMSGYAGDANLQVALHGAGASFLQKPITPEVLAKGVREALGAPRAISTEAAA